MSSEMSKRKMTIETSLESPGERKMPQSTIQTSGRLKVLSEGDIDAIIDAACKVLRETGYLYQWAPALKALESAGAQVDFDTQRVKLPRDLIEACLRTIPKGFRWQGRTAEYDLWVDPAHLFLAAAGAPNIIDRATKKHRTMQLKDIGEWHTFVDHLDNYKSNYPIAAAYDAPLQLQGACIVAEQLKYSKKPFMTLGPVGVIEDAEVQIELCDVAGRHIMGLVGPVSPLSLPDNMCHHLMLWAERRWPVHIWSGPTPGATGPMTLAGTIVMSLCDVLAQVVLAQVVGPGTPLESTCTPMFLDMKNGALYEGIEGALLQIAWAQLWHRWSVVTPGGMGAAVQTPDWQDGAEIAQQMLACALGGLNSVMYGAMGMYMTQSYAALVRGDALFGQVKRFLRGIEVNPETLAVELIQEVGPLGTFLGKQHTKRHVKTELFVPKLFNTAGYDVWLAEGGKDTAVRAEEMADEIWKTLRPDPINEDKCREIDAILKRALARYV